MMKKDKNFDKFKSMLSEDYLAKYKAIEQYILCSNSLFDKKDECLEESLDLLLCAQRDGKSPEDVVGTDIKGFCLNILKSVNTESLSLIISVIILKGSIVAVSVGLFFYLLSIFFDVTPYVQDGKVSILMTYGAAFLTALADFIIGGINRRIILRKGESKYVKNKSMISTICSIICFLVLYTIHLNLPGEISSDILYIDIRTLIIIQIVIFIAGVIFINIDNHGGISALLSGELMAKSKKHWRIMLSEALYQKYYRRKAIKGSRRKEYSLEDFKRDQKREINFSHIILYISLPLYILFEGYLIYITIRRGLNPFIIFSIGILSIIIACTIKYITLKKKQLEMVEELK